MNMSYCRFQNTKKDLTDCVTSMVEAEDLEELDLSVEEQRAMERMMILCGEYIDEYRRLYGIHSA